MSAAPAPVDKPLRAKLKKLQRLAGQLAMLLALAFLARHLSTQVSELRPLQPSVEMALRLGAAILACFGLFVAGVAIWWVLLERPEPGAAPKLGVIFAYSQIAKYLPGSVFQYAFGLAVGNRLGIPASRMGVLLARDTIFSLGVAAALGALGLFSGAQRAALEPFLRHGPSALFVIAALGALLLLGAVAWFLRRRGAWHMVVQGFSAPSPRAAVLVVLLNVVQFTLYGVCAWEIAAIWNPSGVLRLPSLAEMTAGFALAWVAARVFIGAPGGLGVREALLYALFEPALGRPIAVATFVGMRVVLIVSELVFFAPAPFVLRRLERRAGASGPSLTS